MSAKLRALRMIVDAFDDAVVSGPGLNLSRAVRREMSSGNVGAAEGILKRAARGRRFDGNLAADEVSVLRSATQGIDKKAAMPVSEYRALAKASSKEPLVLDASTFPAEMSRRGFTPLTEIDINKPGLTLREFTGPTRERFIDEGAQNLIAAWNLDPAAAQQYARFYPRTAEQLGQTGIPIDRVGGAWATLSAQADPTTNAELLRRILNDPGNLTTSRKNQQLALRFLSGDVTNPVEALGWGKRYNFMQNSISPEDPRFLTADTRYAQNLQGILNAYGRAPFAGLFQPRAARYGDIYAQPGFEAAVRLNQRPSALQAGSWGNWRNRMSGLEADLPDNLLTDLAGFDYNPDVYRQALRSIGGA